MLLLLLLGFKVHQVINESQDDSKSQEQRRRFSMGSSGKTRCMYIENQKRKEKTVWQCS